MHEKRIFYLRKVGCMCKSSSQGGILKCVLKQVEGINNKIKLLKRQAYGYHDKKYFKLWYIP